MRPSSPSRARSGFTLAELLLLSALVGVLALWLAPWVAGHRERRWGSEIRTAMDTLLVEVDAFREARGRWPGTLRELERETAWSADDGIRICTFNIVPSGPDAPYVVVVAGHPRAHTRIFTLHPLWEGRTETYRASGAGCEGREPWQPAAPLPGRETAADAAPTGEAGAGSGAPGAAAAPDGGGR